MDTTTESPREAIDRRQSLLDATFEIIAMVGLEGLRTRAVAERAGVNVATLHYYFPTKESLIQAMAAYLGGKFMTVHAPPPPPTGVAALDWLRQEFADTRFYIQECPDLMTVMQELGIRAGRDEAVRGVLDTMVFYWRRHIQEMVAKGIAEGTFRSDLDPVEVSSTLIALFAGIPAVGSDPIDGIGRAIEGWLVAPEARRGSRDDG